MDPLEDCSQSPRCCCVSVVGLVPVRGLRLRMASRVGLLSFGSLLPLSLSLVTGQIFVLEGPSNGSLLGD